jgi:PAS domain S-box-containing protein
MTNKKSNEMHKNKTGSKNPVNPQKRAERLPHQSEEKYRIILENIQEAYFEVDLSGNFTFFNDSMCRITGCSKEELLGMNHQQFTNKETAKQVFQAFNEVYKTGKSVKGFGWQIIRKDGTQRYIEVSISLQKDSSGKPAGFRGLISDITERKQEEEKLLLIKRAVESASDAIGISDSWGHHFYQNKAFTDLFEYTTEELYAGGATNLYASQDITTEVITALLRGEPWNGDIEMVAKSGRKFPVQLREDAIKDERGNIIGFIGLHTDITERKLTNTRLQDTLESLKKAVGATIQVIVSVIESRDPYTAGHQIRSADIARAIATEMGLSKDQIDGIRLAGSIHDIGKLSIPAEILAKPTKLTTIEFSLIKQHAQSGYEMLKNVESSWPLAKIVHQHHERMNGSGYPKNLKGDEILIEARIMAVADVVESMASNRPYRPALSIDLALEEIEKNKGILYDNTVADACLRLFREKNYHLPSSLSLYNKRN